MSKKKFILKASGDEAIFSEGKVIKSLRRSGASSDLAKEVASKVGRMVHSGMSTRDVYRIAFGLLKKQQDRSVAARYSLKDAIMQLGPTGFPFERFVGEVLTARGFQTKVGITMQGACVTHEVDVLARKGEETQYIVECKFHNSSGYQNNVKIPLYVHSRFQDLEEECKRKGDKAKYEAWIVTNTKFSKDAILYGECKGMTLLGWRYPATGGLEKLIEETGLHPVTCLTTLPRQAKENLLKKDIVLCKDVLKNIEMLRSFGMKAGKIDQLTDEIRGVCMIK